MAFGSPDKNAEFGRRWQRVRGPPGRRKCFPGASFGAIAHVNKPSQPSVGFGPLAISKAYEGNAAGGQVKTWGMIYRDSAA